MQRFQRKLVEDLNNSGKFDWYNAKFLRNIFNPMPYNITTWCTFISLGLMHKLKVWSFSIDKRICVRSVFNFKMAFVCSLLRIALLRLSILHASFEKVYQIVTNTKLTFPVRYLLNLETWGSLGYVDTMCLTVWHGAQRDYWIQSYYLRF